MKILGRILIIATAFSIVAGLIVTIVNASGSNAPGFGGPTQFRPEGNRDGFRPERGERFEGGPRWLGGVIKNVGVIALLVTVIVWPKSVARKKKKLNGINSKVVNST
jgi:hypothetical protein